MKYYFTAIIICLGLVCAGTSFAFTGPATGQTPGTGGGLFNVDAYNNIGFGTTDPTPDELFDASSTQSGATAHGYIFTVASSTNPGIGLKNLTSNIQYLWSARNFGAFQLYREGGGYPGKVIFDISPSGKVGVSYPSFNIAGGVRFQVGEGAIQAPSFIGIGANLTALDPANLTGGPFAATNYAFPSALAVGTSTTVGLPAGGLYVDGDVSLVGGSTIYWGATTEGVRESVTDNTLEIFARGNLRFYADTNDNSSADYIAFYTNQSQGATSNAAVKINDDGSVGIGTNSPENLLHLNLSSNTIAQKFTMDTWDSNDAYAFSLQGTASFPQLRLVSISNGVATDVVTFKNNDIGVGTTTPAAALHVIGGAIFTDPITVGTPSGSSHAATKGYVDSVVGGGSGSGSFEAITVSGTSTFATNNGRVGIGTASPSQKLDVVGKIVASGFRPITLNPESPYGVRIKGDTNGWAVLYGFTGSSNTDLGGFGAYGSADNLNRFFVGTYSTNEKITVLSGGNVGIGNTNPSTKLYVAGTGAFTGTVSVATPTASSHAATKSYVDSVIGGGSGSTVGYWTQSGTDIYNSNSGNVGIGTSTPSEKLEVVGSIKLTDNTLSSDSVTFDSESGIGLRLTNSNGYISLTPLNTSWAHVYTDRSKFIFNRDVYSLTDAFSSYDANLLLKRAGTTKLTLGSSGATFVDPLTISSSGNSSFTGTVTVATPTADSHAATKSYVDSTLTSGTYWAASGNDIYNSNSGKVGIGTSNPISPFHFTTTNSRGLFYQLGSATVGYAGYISFYMDDSDPGTMSGKWTRVLAWVDNGNYYSTEFDINVRSSDDVTRGVMRLHGRTGNNASTAEEAYLYLWNDTTDAWSISNAKLIQTSGSGTNNAYELWVQWASNWHDNTYIDGYLFNRNDNFTVYDGLQTAQASEPTGAVGNWIASTDRYFAGNVGVGDSTPSYKLEVAGTANFTGTVSVGTPTASSHAATKSYVDSVISGGSGSTVGYWTQSGTNIYNSNSGKVGVGTTNPQYGLLEIKPTAGDANTGLTIYDGSHTTARMWIDGSGNWQITRSATANNGIVMKDDGSVGIGKIPSTALDVSGTVTATSFVGALSAQYVSAGQFGSQTGGGNYFFPSSVGIATTTASGGLNLGSTRITNVATPINSGDAATKSYVDSTISSGTYWTASGDDIYNSNSGNVGIGTDSPAAPLHVAYKDGVKVWEGTPSNDEGAYLQNPWDAANGYVRMNVAGNLHWDATENLWKYGASGSNGFGAIMVYSNNGLRFYTKAGTGSSSGTITHSNLQTTDYVRMVITNTGDVGIGTLDPAADLDVVGDIRSNGHYISQCNHAVIDSAGWYRIAVNGNPESSSGGTRATAQFAVWDTDSGEHSATTFYASAHYGNYPRITMVTRSRYSGGLIDRVRIIENSTYDGAAVEIYVAGGLPGSVYYCMFDNVQTNGWTPEDWTVGNLPSGFSTTEINFASLDPVFATAGSGNDASFYVKDNGQAYFGGTVTVATPTNDAHAATKSYVDSYTPSVALACNGDATCEMNGADLNSGNITGVNKITVATIDPLYMIQDKKYATYAPSMIGVKEEYVGTGVLKKSGDTYTHVLDFSTMKESSDLWVWYKTVDFSKNTVQALVTPYGVPATIYYEIKNQSIIFTGDQPAEFSYRLVGSRFDWKLWPTKTDTDELPGLIVK